MNRTDNYLYRAVKGDENSITELFTNLLRRKCFRDVILQSLGVETDCLNSINFSNIKTQLTEVDIGRPDIVIENDSIKYYIEVKTNTRTDFQYSQLSYYPKKLKASGKQSKLIFLVPDDYSHIEKAEKLKDDYESSLIHIAKWSEVIKALVDSELLEDGSMSKEIISFISDVTIKRTPEIIFTPMEVAIMFNTKNATRDIVISASLLFKVRNLLAEVAESLDIQLAKEFGKKYKKAEKSWQIKDIQFDEYCLGMYLDDENIFIGFTFSDDRDFQEYVFSISLSKTAFLKPENYDYFDDKDSDNEFYYIKLKDAYALVESNKDYFIKTIIETLKPIYQQYK